MRSTYNAQEHYAVDAMTGEKRPIDPEQFHLDQLNAVLRGMSTTQIADAIAVEVDAVAKKGGGFKTEISAQDLYAARQRALWNLGERELEKRTQENEARLAALGTPDEQARSRVLRIHQAKLDSRLSLMTAEQRVVWSSEVAVAKAGIASAEVRGATEEIKIFSERLNALGALPPAEDDLEALLEPETHAWGINGSEHSEEVERLKKKHNLDDDLKPRSTKRATRK